MLKSSSYSVRPASADDLAQIVKLDRRNYPQPWTEGQFTAELDKPFSRFLVITDDETDETVIAYCVYWNLDDAIELLNLTVDAEHRRAGYAKLLLQGLIREALRDEKRSVFLEVRKSNQAAIGLYLKFRFEVAQTRKGFYTDGEDAYQMRLDLADAGAETTDDEEGEPLSPIDRLPDAYDEEEALSSSARSPSEGNA